MIWNDLDLRPFSLAMFGKRFSLVQGEKELRISYDFLAEENQNWCEKILKNCQSCFTMVSQKKNLNKNVLNALLKQKNEVKFPITVFGYTHRFRQESNIAQFCLGVIGCLRIIQLMVS